MSFIISPSKFISSDQLSQQNKKNAAKEKELPDVVEQDDIQFSL